MITSCSLDPDRCLSPVLTDSNHITSDPPIERPVGGFVRPYLEAGRVELVRNVLEFSQSAHVVHSAKAKEGMIARIRAGLRGAVM